MANRFLNNIKINDSYTLPAADGTADQIIKTNGTGELSFIDQGDVVAGEADKAKSVILRVKNSTASAMSKGQVVCEAVSATPPSGNLIEVALADNNGTNTMPALGVLNEDLDAAGGANDEGDAIMFGKVSGIDTSAFSVGDEVFVDDTPGGLTTTKPTGVKYIQKVGVVIRDDASNGTIEVFGAGRVNDVPTPLYIDHANQRLGIGAEAPGAQLQIDTPESNGNGQGLRINRPSAGTHYHSVEFSTSGVVDWSIGQNSNDAFEVYENGLGASTRFTIKEGGNVGIGTTNPSTKLHVSGTGNQGMQAWFGNGFINNASYHYDFARVGFSVEDNDGADTGAGFQFNTRNSGDTNWLHGYIYQPQNGGIAFGTGGAGTIQATERMRIDSSGNVGIGVTSPSEKLEVAGNITQYPPTGTGGYLKLGQNVGANDVAIELGEGRTTSGVSRIDFIGDTTYTDYGFRAIRHNSGANATSQLVHRGTGNFELVSQDSGDIILNPNSGNVGIGVTSPSAKLHVEGDGSIIRLQNNNSDANGTFIDFRDSTGTRTGYVGTTGASDDMFLFTQGAKPIRFYTNASEHMRIDSSGNVGIGTTIPQQKLDVNGNIAVKNSTQISFDSNNGDLSVGGGAGRMNLLSNSLAIDYSGNVGIGTTSPNEKLEVNGDIRVMGTDNHEHVQFYYNGSRTGEIGSADSTWLRINQHTNKNIYTPRYIRADGGFFVDGTSKGLNGSGDLVLVNCSIGSSGDGNHIHVNCPTALIPEGTTTSTNTGLGTGSYKWKNVFAGSYYTEDHFVFGTSTSEGEYITRSGNDIRFVAGGNTRLTVDGDAGNVGIGTTGPGDKLHVKGDIRIEDATDSTTRDQILRVQTNGALSFIDSVSGERMRIDWNGNVGIGQTNPSTYKLDVSGTIRATGDVIAYSDIRVKENIKTIDNAVDKVKALRGVKYNKINSAEQSIGVIAQEIEDVIPEVVREDDQGMKSVAYGNITAVLIEAIKEQQKQIDELKNQLNAFTK